MNVYTIYKITNKINNKLYIGWTNRKNPIDRLKKHILDCNYPERRYKLQRAIIKYGAHNFTFDIIYQSYDGDHSLKVMEPYFIKEYDTFKTGYNSTKGGDGILGFVYSKETRKKMSLAVKESIKIKGPRRKPGHKASNETKLLMSINRKGNFTGSKNPMYGKKQSEKTKLLISESQKLRHKLRKMESTL